MLKRGCKLYTYADYADILINAVKLWGSWYLFTVSYWYLDELSNKNINKISQVLRNIVHVFSIGGTNKALGVMITTGPRKWLIQAYVASCISYFREHLMAGTRCYFMENHTILFLLPISECGVLCHGWNHLYLTCKLTSSHGETI